jgi:MoaA/NifB/PqqE/SkfB family radical SAM enzyme
MKSLRSLVLGHSRLIHQKRLREQGLESSFNWGETDISSLVIGIYRENFFCLGRILSALGLTEKIEDFSPFPSTDILDRWLRYHRQLMGIALSNPDLSFEYLGGDVLEILTRIQERIHPQLEKDALRALGAVCNHAFLGPKRLLVDPNVDCDLDCIYCRLHSGLRKEDKAQYFASEGLSINSHLDWTILEKRLDEAAQMGVEEICVVGGGEPTLYPHFRELTAKIKGSGMVMNVSTNGLGLNQDFSAFLVDQDVNRITISVSGVDPASYKIIHPSQGPDIYPRLREKILELNLLKEARRKSSDQPVYLQTDILHVVHTHNYKQILRMILDAKELRADRVWFQLLHMNPFSKFLCLNQEQIEETRFLLKEARLLGKKIGVEVADYMDLQVENAHEDGTWSKNVFEDYGCLVGWYFAYLDVQGELNFCCGDKMIDEVKTRGLMDLWNSPLYGRWRELARNYDWSRNIRGKNGEYLLDAYCHNCDNHNFNSEMVGLLKHFDLLPYLRGRYQQKISTSLSKHLSVDGTTPFPVENTVGKEGWYFNISLTHSCQFRCQFCDTWKNKPRPKDELKISDWLSLLETCQDHLKDIRLNFAGGEPLLKADFHQLLRYCSKKNIYTSLATNAGAFTKQRAYEIATSGINVIGISLDGLKDTHDRLRGVPGSFDKIFESISWIRENNQSSEINLLSIILKDNLNDLYALVRRVDEDPNITHIHFQALSILGPAKSGWWKKHPLWPDTNEVLELLDFLIDHQARQRESGHRPVTIANPKEQLLHMKAYFKNPGAVKDQVCTIDQTGYTLDAEGNLYYCPFKKPLGNLLKTPLAEITAHQNTTGRIHEIRNCQETYCHLRTNCCFETQDIPEKYLPFGENPKQSSNTKTT